MEMTRTLPEPLAPALLLAALLACGSTKMTSTGEEYPAKPANCEFKVFTTVPEGHWEEIAVIDVRSGANHTDIADFKKEIQPKACEAGGDAVIALANGDGVWIKATVLKAQGAPPAVPATAPPAAAQPRTAASTPASAGCQFDTQCKGERICEQGRCVMPPVQPPTTAPEAAATPTTPAAPAASATPPAPAK